MRIVATRLRALIYYCRMSEVTRLISAMGDGDANAAEAVLPLVYDELRQLARAQMRHERAGHTLEATALVHEAYLRLIKDAPDGWDGRRHFFAAAAEAMRRILIEHARRKKALKYGGGRERVDLSDETPEIASPCSNIDDLLSLNEALNRLERQNAALAEVIKLLYFAGLRLDEAAAMLGLSKTTAHRQAVFARAWLYEAMERVPR